MTTAFIFPGQGSQFVSMGKDLADNFAEAREVFTEVDDTLSQKLSQIMFEGPESDLNLTENTQPALMAVSMAVLRVLEAEKGVKIADASYVAGHSLGEYPALCAAGVITLADTARLLKLRGQAMQRAVPVGQGAMAAVLGLEMDAVQDICTRAASESEICEAANDNSDGQIVISGHASAIERAGTLAVEAGARKCVPLPVSAPFHCSLMQPAADEMAAALASVHFDNPAVPVVCNVTASSVSDPDQLRDNLVNQITGTVRWRESVQWMHEQGVDQYYELGAGKVLCGLVKRIDRDATATPVGTMEKIKEF